MKSMKISFLLLAIGITFLGCDDNIENEDPIEKTKLSFHITHEVATEPLELDTIKYVNGAGDKYSVETLKYFVSKFILHQINDGAVTYFVNEHYIDARDSTTFNLEFPFNVYNGEYSHISFVFGIDTYNNISGKYLNPPESNMEWPMAMGPGYHYMKLEGKYEMSDANGNYQCHTGQSMGFPYNINVELPVSFVAEGQDLNIEIVMDINKWWESPNSLNFDGIKMIMGNQTMQQRIMENGVDVFSVGSIQLLD